MANGHTDQHDEILQANALFPLKSIFAAFIWRYNPEVLLIALHKALDSLALIYMTIPGKERQGKRLKLVCLCLEQALEFWKNSQDWSEEQLNDQLAAEEAEKMVKDATFTNQLGSLRM
jgi:hypothetical protein